MAERAENFGRILRGDQAIARYIFCDARKRRLVKGLQKAGWAISISQESAALFPTI